MSAEIKKFPKANKKPSISVVMVSFMTGPALMEAVSSVLADPDITELIIVDNGNTEPARQRLSEVCAQSDKIRLLQGHGNIGFSRACNYGAKISKSDYLLFLNPDAVISAGAALKMVECGAQLQTPWLVGALVRDVFGKEQRGGRRGRLTPFSAFVTFTGLSKLPFINSMHRENEPLPQTASAVPTVTGACMMTDRASFEMLRGFDENYFLHVEDIDICERTRRLDGDVYFHPKATVMHYGSTSSVTRQTIEYEKFKGFVHYFLKFSENRFQKALTYAAIPFMGAAIMGRAWWLALRQGLTGR